MFSAWEATVRAETWNTRRQQLAGDLIHIRDHQQKTLRSGISRRQSAGGQRAVNGAGSAGLGLHLHNLDAVAEDILHGHAADHWST